MTWAPAENKTENGKPPAALPRRLLISEPSKPPRATANDSGERSSQRRTALG